MCTTKPVTENSIQDLRGIIGLDCPLCADGTRLAYMQFLDPHGVMRVDPELFECTAKRHSYTTGTQGLRLLASDGKMAPPRGPEFILESGALKPA
jgi:hypothetical protein